MVGLCGPCPVRAAESNHAGYGGGHSKSIASTTNATLPPVAAFAVRDDRRKTRSRRKSTKGLDASSLIEGGQKNTGVYLCVGPLARWGPVVGLLVREAAFCSRWRSNRVRP